MLCETAKVAHIASDEIYLEVPQANHCQSCASKAGCGHSLLSKFHFQRIGKIKLVLEGFDGEEGSLIEIGLPKSQFVYLSLIIYGLPLLTMIMMLLITRYFDLTELLTITCTFLGLGVGFLAIKLAQVKLNSLMSLKVMSV